MIPGVVAGGALDSPTPPAAVTWNPADKSALILLDPTLLIATRSGGPSGAYGSTRASLARDATDLGGFYFEVPISDGSSSPFIQVGVADAEASLTNGLGANATGWSYYQETGNKINNGSTTAYGASYTTGNVIGILVKNGKLYFRKNGVWQNGADVDAETGEAFSGLTGMLFPAISLYRATAPAHVVAGRFKAADFSGSLPIGVAAWEVA